MTRVTARAKLVEDFVRQTCLVRALGLELSTTTEHNSDANPDSDYVRPLVMVVRLTL